MNKDNQPQFTNTHKNYYSWLKNILIKHGYKDINDDYLKTVDKKDLLNFIKSSSYSLSSKEGLIFMVARWLLLNIPSSPYIKIYQEEGYKYKVQRDEEEGKNKQTDKEAANYKPLSYFDKIIKDSDYYNIKQPREQFKVLALALITYQPPLRTSFYTTAKIINDIEQATNPNENYILIQPTKVYYIVNFDKVSKKKAHQNNKVIEVKNKDLIKMLNYSINTFKRANLFETYTKPNNNLMGVACFIKYLHEVSKINLNVDLMRSIHINEEFKKPGSNYNDKKKLVDNMRTSTQTALKNYYKLSPDDKTTEPDKLNKTKSEQPTEADYNNLIYKKNRADALYNMNVRKTAPKVSTIKKYSIKQHKDGTYY